MKSQLLKYLLLLWIAALAPVAAAAQGRIYTRKARLADFPSKSVMVVSDEENPLLSRLRSEMMSRWRISVYDFCSESVYQSLKSNPAYYFLVPVEQEGILFLSLHKGDGYEVVRIPVCAAESPEDGLGYLAAYLDIIQRYVEDARKSEKVAYSDLGAYNRKVPKSDPGPLVEVRVGRYEMVFSDSTHELYRFRKHRNGKSSRQIP